MVSIIVLAVAIILHGYIIYSSQTAVLIKMTICERNEVMFYACFIVS